jgi:hypothetical protein
VDAVRSKADGTIEVRTKNVNALMLTSPGAKSVKLDGQTFPGGADLSFQKRGGAWKAGVDQGLRKRHGLQGPIDDVFFDSFLCVRPTGQTPNDLAGRYAQETLDAFVDDFGKYFRGQVPVKNDTDVTPADIADRHLVLFGDAQSNQLLGRMIDRLPVRWNAQGLSFNGKTFDAARHTIAMVYPNPLDPRRYVVLNSGHSFHRNEMAATNATLFPRFGDYAVLHLRQTIGAPVEAEILNAGYFDEEWKLQQA